MSEERVHPLDAESLALFARKGWEAGPGAPQTGPANGVKVRRVMQLTRDLAGRPFEALRILDVGCGEGVYAIEAALRGARVVALDARSERMDLGAACAARVGIRTVQFVLADVRHVTRQAYGDFDVVYCLGLLYHLDAPDVFAVLENLHALCARMMIVDTLVSLAPDCEVAWRGCRYRGARHREHGDDDPPEVRRSRVLRSIDNTFSFRFARESLVRALHDAGFTSVLEGHAPLEPGKAPDRITVVAMKGARVLLSTYPWVNHRSEEEIAKAVEGSP
ncbi:MAG: methyltransferase domain-containing protein [Armatimonadota bacterium]|nr:methyltransferase domain-containing protein [Armatimonadota bacterium]MDR7423274.1 methyltransferase domain-containing protein [Armatimonadota bacterium]MDR7453831.1 methyltransferase domain-containing protein [Armatimonadota bacterium]MDR7456432.1 methyltransferase domain-containing protein [Armatimonadota bacterium]MDR7495922.1 methyltransferase domain-containing protein [Armatimonadota bacterium]